MDSRQSGLENLESLALLAVLKNIPINACNEKVMGNYVEQYSNPALVNTYIKRQGLYYVYSRNEDSYCSAEDNPICNHYLQVRLLKSFASNDAAIKWIVSHGRETGGYEDVGSNEGPVVLFILYSGDYRHINVGDNHEYLYGISESRLPTYAFTKNAFKMALLEYQLLLKKNIGWRKDRIPHWIHYILEDGTEFTE